MFYQIFFAILFSFAICNPWHWNIGIGITIGNGTGIGTDVKRVIICSSVMPMDPKFSTVATQDEGNPTQGHVTHRTRNLMVTWQIKDVIFSLSQGLWTPNLAGWGLQMRGPHSSHVIHQSSAHVKNLKYFIFNFTSPKAHKLSRVVTRIKRPNITCHVTPRSHRHVIIIKQAVYICSKSS